MFDFGKSRSPVDAAQILLLRGGLLLLDERLQKAVARCHTNYKPLDSGTEAAVTESFLIVTSISPMSYTQSLSRQQKTYHKTIFSENRDIITMFKSIKAAFKVTVK